MEHLPLPLDQLAPSARRAADPTTPEAARLGAATGLIALPPAHLLPLLYNLSFDTVERVRSAAVKSLEGLPSTVAAGAVKTGVAPIVCDWLARKRPRDDELVEAILLAPHTLDDTVLYLAGQVGERQCEIIAANEVRLLRRPVIIETLYMNPRARMSTVQRCVELAVHQNIVLEGLPAYREIAAAITGRIGAANEEEDAAGLAADAAQAASEAAAAEDAELIDDAFARTMEKATEEKELEPDERQSIQEQIAGMSINEKIRAATLGNQTIRSYLVRSTNRLVALAAIKSPRISDGEVVSYAQSRAVPDDVIRYIAYTRELQRHYAVKVGLVNNPKCPLPTALRMLSYLRAGDLKAITHNKNVSRALAENAKRLLATKKT